MIVNVEFLGNEPIENVITALNYKIDKTIFFGYKEVIDEMKERTDKFLKKYCNVEQTKYVEVSHTKLKSIIDVMSAEIEREYRQGNEIYFDVTGGESLILVAFGIIAEKVNAPMHMYDVKSNKLMEYDDIEGRKPGKLSEHAQKQNVKFNIKQYIEMYGGIVNSNLKKEAKQSAEEGVCDMLKDMWNVMYGNKESWNAFSDILKRMFKPDDNLETCSPVKNVRDYYEKNPYLDDSLAGFNKILNELENCGALTKLSISDEYYSFRYVNHDIKYYLWDCGSIFEYYTYSRFRENADDCEVGVHIDWDGVVNEFPGKDVLNEIDVIALNGYIPTFVSCKTGKMKTEKALFALYELETVASRFGKKYAKKVLMITEPLTISYKMRAKEMDIEVIVV